MSRGLEYRSGWLRAALLLFAVLALSARLLVPAGYMPDSSKGVMLTLCSGSGTMETITVDLHKDGQSGKATVDHAPCAFSASATPMISGVPPIFLATALAYIIEHGRVSDAPAPAIAAVRLRPPLRAPPAA